MTQEWKPGDSCAIKGCDRPVRSVAFCAHHYDMFNRYGHPLAGVLFAVARRGHRTLSKERKAYSAMKKRCSDFNKKGYADYGGRGIKVCDRWSQSFFNFIEDMGSAPPGATLDRINNDGNYEPGNCRWTDRKTQQRNRRPVVLTEAKVLEARRRRAAGERITEIAKSMSAPYNTLYQAVAGNSWKELEE